MPIILETPPIAGAVTLRFTVEDITTKMETYDVIRVYRANSLGGTYSVIDTVTLVADTYHYDYADSTGDLNKWYKYSFYHSVALDESILSDPFRVDVVTRLRVRQGVLDRYGAGIVLVNSGTDSDKITTADFRFRTAFFPANRGKGQWLLPTSGNNAGVARIISESSPTAGTMTVLPVWGSNMAAGDEAEWHTLVDPTQMDKAVNRGLSRYWYVDRVPLVCVAGQEEYSLAALPWLTDKGQIHDVRWYPNSTLDVDESYVGNGRWWKPRQDGARIVLTVYPVPAADTVLYLECTRPMPPLHADAAALPNVANEGLAVALAYDEVLKYLSSFGVGTAEAQASYLKARVLHGPELRRLLSENRPKPRHGPVTTPWPPVAHAPFKAR